MKTNVSIELSDEERRALADVIDGKVSKRLATRAEVVEICRRHIAGLTRASISSADAKKVGEVIARQPANDLYTIDESDPLSAAIARPNDPGYIYGWNKVKRSSEK